MTGAIRCKNNPTGSCHPVGPFGSVFSVKQQPGYIWEVYKPGVEGDNPLPLLPPSNQYLRHSSYNSSSSKQLSILIVIDCLIPN